MNKYIDFTDEVKEALDNNKPIVAIETGGTFEGIPYPENVETANTVMNEIRKAGAVPAYVSIINGRVKVGMTDTEINEYAKLRGKMTKASGRKSHKLLLKAVMEL